MTKEQNPRDYLEWRTSLWQRKDDAANCFGKHFIEYCRNNAIQNIDDKFTDEQRKNAIESIDIALHNVMDLLEGFWKIKSGEEHYVEYHLNVVVKNNDHKEVEVINIAPGLDLPIGFWNWINDKFRTE